MMHFTAAPVVGGVEHVMNQHARLMQAAGHRVRVIAARGSQMHKEIPFFQLHLADSMQPDILALKESLDKGGVPKEFEEVKDMILKELEIVLKDTEIIIAHNICSLVKNLALTAALKDYTTQHSEVKLISWQHDLAFAADRYASELHEGYPWNLVSTPWKDSHQSFVAVSEKTRNEVHNVFGVPSEEIAVISSGVDEHEFLGLTEQTSKLIGACNISSQNTILLLPVRITRRKNIELAIEIASKLIEKLPTLSLVVTGPPGAHNTTNSEYFDKLLKLRQSLKLEPKSDGSGVHFLYEQSRDFLPDEVISGLYRIAHGLLMTSTDEGLGIPVIEACFAKLPLFCSDIPTFREITGKYADQCTFFGLNEDSSMIAHRIYDTLSCDKNYLLRRQVQATYSWDEIYRTQIAPIVRKK